MADTTQLKRLRRGVVQWNEWKSEHQETEIDLNDVNLHNVNLRDVNLRSADLCSADLRFANLCSADLTNANLSNANLTNANLSNANLCSADLTNANLRFANLSDTNLRDTNLSDADLRFANLSDADLRFANLSNANLSDADLRFANLSDANLSDANLRKTNLRKTNLRDVDFHGVTIRDTSFGDRDFREIKGLDTITHSGPSPLSINSLYLSEGDIPEAFVRGTGAPDTFIEYMRALTAHPIEYYTCFLSYSSQDQPFAERLYNDLQGKNIRCWYAPEDLKTGEFFWRRIDESIRLYDKLVVILSSHSVESDWVEREVMAALEKEGQQKRPVLFPLRLDNTLKTTSAPWAADMRRRRHITDFTGWETNYTMYQKGLERVLRDLKQERE